MKDEIRKYSKEQQKLKDYFDNVSLEQVINKLKDNDGMAWWVDWKDYYQPVFKKIYHQEVSILLDYITNLQQENQDYKSRIDKAREYIKILGKYDGERCIRNFKIMSADFNHILELLGGDSNE